MTREEEEEKREEPTSWWRRCPLPAICCDPRLILHEVPGAMRSGGSLGTAGPHRAVRVSA